MVKQSCSSRLSSLNNNNNILRLVVVGFSSLLLVGCRAMTHTTTARGSSATAASAAAVLSGESSLTILEEVNNDLRRQRSLQIIPNNNNNNNSTITDPTGDDNDDGSSSPNHGIGSGGVCQMKQVFDMKRHKEIYTVGVLAIRGYEAAYTEFNKTFNDYLTATVGKRYTYPSIQFVMKPLNFINLFSDTADGNVDFIYVNPSAFSCIESEYEAYSLASQVSRRVINGKQYDLKKFGGVIAARANDNRIETIYDIQDKIVAAASISGLGSGQMQFREMTKSGMDYLNDPKQLVFTSNQGKVVNGLLNGEFDVGFIRTDQIERTKDSEGNLINSTLLKVLNPQPNLNIDGIPFPFQSSTPLYPEWNIAALTHVPADVSMKVQEAMMAIADHGRIGSRLRECHNQFDSEYCDSLPFPSNFTTNDEEVRCDTTKEIALLAIDAMTAGKYSSWQSTLSYMQLRSMQESTGFITQNEKGDWHCIRSTNLYDSITCPSGQVLKSPEEFHLSCSSEHALHCKDGYQCVCHPCYTPQNCIDSIKIGNRCVAYTIFLPSLLVPIFLLAFATCLGVVSFKSKQLVNQAEKAAQNERDLNDFIAHEVRNPLTAALSASTFLNSALHGNIVNESAHQSLREDAGIVDGSLRFINDLLRSMLDVHKAASKKMTLDYSQVGLHEDIFEPVRSMIYTRDTKFQVVIDCPKNLTVQTDKLRFQQVVLNLARNAAKFVDEGFIRLRADVIHGSVQVFIEDSGPGIPEDKRDHLFSRFQQSLDSLAQGTGVGLNLCKYLVELMGGEIYLDGDYKSGYKNYTGARIVINLNQAPDHYLDLGDPSNQTPGQIQVLDPDTLADSDESTESDIELGGLSPAITSCDSDHVDNLPKELSVLFVDDDRILRKQGARAMTNLVPSWKFREAASGETALQLVDTETFDFIFMDQYMTSVEQSMKGTETVRALRARGVKSVICGLSANDMQGAFESAGADAFHLKPLPCSENELRKVLEELLVLKKDREHKQVAVAVTS